MTYFDYAKLAVLCLSLAGVGIYSAYVRGRGEGGGNFNERFQYGMAFALVACAIMTGALLGLVAGLGAFVGMLIPHGAYFSMGYWCKNEVRWLDFLVGKPDPKIYIYYQRNGKIVPSTQCSQGPSRFSWKLWRRSVVAMAIIDLARATLIFAPLQLWAVLFMTAAASSIARIIVWAVRREEGNPVMWSEIAVATVTFTIWIGAWLFEKLPLVG